MQQSIYVPTRSQEHFLAGCLHRTLLSSLSLPRNALWENYLSVYYKLR